MPSYLIKPAASGGVAANDSILLLDTQLPVTSPALSESTDYEAFELSAPFSFKTAARIEAPVAFSLHDLIAVEGDGPFVIDLTHAFSGTDLSYGTDMSWATVSGTSLVIEDVVRDGIVEITAQNSEGSAVTTLIVAISEAPDVPASFAEADWTLQDAQNGSEALLIIATLPDSSGSALTDIEFRLDGGPWSSLGGTAPGDYTLSGLPAEIDIDVELRALNAEGPGPVSLAKEVYLTLQPLLISQGASFDEITFEAESGLYLVEIFAPAEFAGQYSFDIADLNAGPVNLAPPIFINDIDIGQTLSFGQSLWVGNSQDSDISIAPEWRVGGVPQSTAESYTIVDGDPTQGITLNLTGTNSAGARNLEVVILPPIEVPVYSEAPEITGILEPGETVSLSAGIVTADEIEYRWMADGSSIAGADSPTLILTPDLVGKTLSGESRARRTGGDWSAWQGATGSGLVAGNPTAAYVEQAVTVSRGTYIELRNAAGAAVSLAPATPHFMAFVSVAPDSVTRQTVLSWHNQDGRIDLWTGTPALMRTSIRAGDDVLSAVGSQQYSAEDRVSMLLATYPNGPDLDIVGYTWRSGEADWSQTISNSITDEIDLAFLSPFNIFARNSGTQEFGGTAYRVAAWAGTAMPDIRQQAVRDNFMLTSTQGTDPALSHGAYGQPLVDLYGNASSWNDLMHYGSLTGLVKLGGDFTDAE